MADSQNEHGNNFWDDVWEQALAKGAPSADDTSYWPNDIDEVKLDFLRPHLPAMGSALEVGCGSARLLARVGRSAKNLQLIAIDESAAALRCAAQTAEMFGVSIDARAGSAAKLPMETGSVDLVLSGGLLEHFPDPRPVLAEMFRVLRAGGVLYADVVPRKKSWYRWAEAERLQNSEWLAPNVFESSSNAQDYRRWLEELGCEHVVTRYCGVYPNKISRLGPGKRRLLGGVLKMLDGTLLAERWGWYFMLVAKKAG